jgi:hypothetical protein
MILSSDPLLLRRNTGAEPLVDKKTASFFERADHERELGERGADASLKSPVQRRLRERMSLAAGALRFSRARQCVGPIPEWAAVGFFAPPDGARDADELGVHRI